MTAKEDTTVVRLLKDLGQDFGCAGDVYRNTEAQMEALMARVKKLKLSPKEAFEIVEHDVKEAVDSKAAGGAPAATGAAGGK